MSTALPPLPEGRLRRFAHGLFAPVRGALWLVRHPELWPWAALPMLLTIWSILGALWMAWSFSDDVLAWFWPRPKGALLVAWAVVEAVFLLSSFVVSALALWVLGHLIAGPFYDRMAEAVEAQVVGPSGEAFDWSVAIGDALLSFRHSLLGLVIYASVVVPLLLLNLIPGIGSAAYAVCGALATGLFLSRDLFDVPLSRRRTSFVGKVRYLRDHFWLAMGLGLGTAGLLAVPLVDLLVLPCAVLGATLLYLAIETESGRLVQRRPAAPSEGHAEPPESR